jgi:molybdopterin-guanine dinucleotide biosynthesis protein A
VSTRDATALILCGGRSTRFGSDKALAKFRGQTLIERAVGTAKDRFTRVAIVAKHPESYSVDALQIADGAAVSTPLAGLVAGLERCSTDLVVALAVDMPFALDDALLAALFAAVQGRGAAIPEHRGTLQPLCSVWRRWAALDAARDLLAQNAGPRALALAIDAAIVPWDDERPFLDADTPQELERLSRL